MHSHEGQGKLVSANGIPKAEQEIPDSVIRQSLVVDVVQQPVVFVQDIERQRPYLWSRQTTEGRGSTSRTP